MHGTTELGGIIGNDASGGLVRGDALFVVCKTKAVVACSWCGGKRAPNVECPCFRYTICSRCLSVGRYSIVSEQGPSNNRGECREDSTQTYDQVRYGPSAIVDDVFCFRSCVESPRLVLVSLDAVTSTLPVAPLASLHFQASRCFLGIC